MAFLTLQGISYTVDIHRGKVKWAPNIIETLVYFTLFPVVFAGPILKYHEISEQIKSREITLDKIPSGLCRFVVGLAKVCLIAMPLLSLSRIVTDRSNLSGIYTSAPVSLMLLGLLACVTGMYHSLSGFSDMAIGLGKMLGFTFPENFCHPQLAATVTTFWQRCFITFTGWFEEYVYESLAKKHKNNDQMVLYMLLMWLLAGLWTGPGLPHLFFGFWNFVFLLFEKIVEMRSGKTKNPLRHLYVLAVMLVSVMALNVKSTYELTLYISNLFGMKEFGFHSDFAIQLLRENGPVLLAGLVTMFPIATKLREWFEDSIGFLRGIYSLFYLAAMAALLALLVLKLSAIHYDPAQLVNTFLWS